MRKLFIALILIPLVAGCASKGRDYGDNVTDYSDLHLTFSADLENGGEGWEFKNIQRGYDREVRLDNFYSIDASMEYGDCYKGLWGLTQGSCREPKFGRAEVPADRAITSLFYTPMFQVLMALSAPISLFSEEATDDFSEIGFDMRAVKSNPDSLVLPLFSEQKFDWDGYWSAVEEAKETNDFDKRFREASSELRELREVVFSTQREQSRYARSNESSIINEARSFYFGEEESRKKIARESIDINIIDKSGFLAINGDVEEIKDEISIDSVPDDSVSELRGKLESKRNPNLKRIAHEVTRDGVILSDISDLEEGVDEGWQQLDETKRVNKEIIAKHEPEVKKVNERNMEHLSGFRESVSSSSFQFVTDYEEVYDKKLENFNLGFAEEGPLVVNADGGIEGEIRDVFIESYDLDYTFFPEVRESDDVLNVVVREGRINISNTSDDFVTIDNIALYNKDNITTRSGEAFANLELLPPRSQKSERLDSYFSSPGLRVLQKRLKAQGAEGIRYEYGVVISYRVSGENKERTIDEVKNFNLLTLIEEQLYQ